MTTGARDLAWLAEVLEVPPGGVVAAQPAADDAMPWFLQLGLGIGAWIAALLLLAAGIVLVIVPVIFGTGQPGPPLLVCALCAAIAATAAGAQPSPFRKPFADAFYAAAIALGAAGVGITADELWPAALAAVACAAAVAARLDRPVVQFLATVFAIAMVLVAIDDTRLDELLALGTTDLVVPLTLPLGLALLVLPVPGRDLRPAALALVLSVPALMIMFDVESAYAGARDPLLSRISALASAVALAAIYARTLPPARRGRVVQVVVAALVVLLLAPPTLTTGFLLMATGYVLGVKAVAGIGAALAIWSISHFYYDLALDLLTKSLLLALIGAIFLGIWWLTRPGSRGLGWSPLGEETDR